MSVIKSGWTYIGRFVGWVLIGVLYLELLILIVWIVVALIVSLVWGEVVAPPAELALILTWIPWAALILLGVACLALISSIGLLILDSLLNFVINLFTPGVRSLPTLWNDIKAGASRAIDGIKDGIKDGVKAAVKPIKDFIDWLRS
ncbi:MAG: hypothetical protein ACLQMT_12000 [Candidatus Acidiferrales bacterium]